MERRREGEEAKCLLQRDSLISRLDGEKAFITKTPEKKEASSIGM